MTNKKNTNKTTFEAINNALATMSSFFTVEDNEVNQYARICFTDNFKKDNYKIMKDFAIYYDRKDSYKISIADSTLTDCKCFKENHERSEKTKALEFSIKADNLFNTVCEITAQRLTLANKYIEVVEHKTKVNKRSKTERKAK